VIIDYSIVEDKKPTTADLKAFSEKLRNIQNNKNIKLDKSVARRFLELNGHTSELVISFLLWIH
jgi:hypothetical protein